jgi:hypothetical protein
MWCTKGLSGPRSHNVEDHRVILTRFLAELEREVAVVASTMDLLGWLRKHLEAADTDLLREMVLGFVQALMSAEADVLCGAPLGERSGDRVNRRNGYRPRRLDTRVGTMELAIPKLRQGSYFPDWLLEPRRRAERALVAVVAECYVRGVSTRRVEGLVETLGIQSLSKSQVSELARSLDGEVAAFRTRPLDAGGYPYVWLDALAVKCREHGRIVNIAAVVATGVNAEGHREILGVDVLTTETAPGGPRSCATWWRVGWVASSWSSPTRMPGSGRRSPRCCPALRGSGAAPISSATCSRACPRARRGWWPRWSGRSLPSPMPPPRWRSTPAWSSSSRSASPPRPTPAGRCCRRPAGLYRLPEGALAADLVQQSAGAAQQGAAAAHRRGGDFPQPRRGRAPRRRSAGRAA